MDIDSRKFSHPHLTANGEPRACIALTAIKTLWFNTGTQCNLSCQNCYIESSPSNNRLSYISLTQVQQFLNEIQVEGHPTEEIGLTGGEPFMNPDIMVIMAEILRRGFKLLVLSNAMRPMLKHQQALLRLHQHYPGRLQIRVSMDHHRADLHEQERGAKSCEPMLEGLKWLNSNGFTIAIAGRTRWGDANLREGYAELFARLGLSIDAHNPQQLVLFPEMDQNSPVPEITSACWGKLGLDPEQIMCASSRMVVVHRGDNQPSVQACTLLAYDQRFNLGATLAEADTEVPLNHPHCARFCVLGGGSCAPVTETGQADPPTS